MRFKILAGALATFLWAGAVSSFAATADHLLITKVLFDCPNPEDAAGSSEFIEIINPTNSPVSLDNYFLSDVNFAEGARYYNLPEMGPGGKITLSHADFLLQFPAGHTLQPGQVAVVTQSARQFLLKFFSGMENKSDLADIMTQLSAMDVPAALNKYSTQRNSPLLFEVTNSTNPYEIAQPVDGVPQMINHTINTYDYKGVNANRRDWHLNMTNGGEFVSLFYWDGGNTLIKDVDSVAWGAANLNGADGFPRKTGKVLFAGTPDEAAYKTDAGNGSEIIVNAATSGGLSRTFLVEPSEPTTDGNGITGHDESKEIAAQSWARIVNHNEIRWIGTTPPANPPGVVNALADMISFSEVERSVKYPAPNEDIFLRALVSHTEAVSSAKFHVNVSYPIASGTHAFDMVFASGSAEFKESIVNIGSYPEGTYIKWYAEVKDTFGASLRYPTTGENVFLVTSNPVAAGDLVINELMYDPSGTDNTSNAEWVEIYNTNAAEIDLSYFRFGIHETNRGRFEIPEGTKIPGNGYLILTGNKELFESRYASLGLETNSIVQFQPTALTANTVPNSNTNMITISHVNEYDKGSTDSPTVHLDQVSYEVGSNSTAEPPIISTWPGYLPVSPSTPYDVANPNNGGPSIELKDTTLDNSVGANWAVSTAPIIYTDDVALTNPCGGTPGAQNSVTGTSNIVPWQLY